MSHGVCPFWMGYLLLCPFRRIGQNPGKILAPYVTNGATVLEVGPGMGFFTLPVAKMAGPNGKVVCVDLQEEMLAMLASRRCAMSGRSCAGARNANWSNCPSNDFQNCPIHYQRRAASPKTNSRRSWRRPPKP